MKINCFIFPAICLLAMIVGCNNDQLDDSPSIIYTDDPEITGDYDLVYLDEKDSLTYFVEINKLINQVKKIDMFAGHELISYTFDEYGRPQTYTSYDRSYVIRFGNYKDNMVDVVISDGEKIYLLDKIEAPVLDETRSIRISRSSSENDSFFESKNDIIKYAWGVVESSIECIVDAAQKKWSDLAFDYVMAHFRAFEPAINNKVVSRFADVTDFASSFGGYLAVAGTVSGSSLFAWVLAMESAWDAGNALGELVAETQVALTETFEELNAMLKGGHGKLKVTLSWSFYADIDLHAIEPNGNEIYWDNPTSSTGGFLDCDNRKGGPGAVENIYWENPEDGLYKFYLNYFDGSQSGICKAIVTYNGNATPFEIPMTMFSSFKNFNNLVVNKSTRSVSVMNTDKKCVEITIDTKKKKNDVPIVYFNRISD